MSTSSIKFSVAVAPLGAGYERELSDDEMRVLRKLLIGNDDPETDDNLLSDFAGFMAAEVSKDDEVDRDDLPQLMKSIGEMAASYALRLRHYASSDEWPHNVTPPGFVFGIVELWLNQVGGSVDGMPVVEYLRSDGVTNG